MNILFDRPRVSKYLIIIIIIIIYSEIFSDKYANSCENFGSSLVKIPLCQNNYFAVFSLSNAVKYNVIGLQSSLICFFASFIWVRKLMVEKIHLQLQFYVALSISFSERICK